MLRFLARIQSQDIEQAGVLAGKISSEHAGDGNVAYLIGSAYALTGDTATARAYFEESLRIDGNNVSSLVNLARLDAQDGRLDAAEERLERFLLPLEILPFDTEAGRHYGTVRRQLRLAGLPIGSNDLLIAAHAVSLDVALVTNNVREFERVDGVRVERWT